MIPMHYIPGERPLNREDITYTARLIGRATGGRAGTIVLVASIMLSALSAVAIYSAEPKARQAFLEYNHVKRNVEFQGMRRRGYFWLAYGSSALLFLSFIMENIYIFFITRTEILSFQTVGPRIRWRRHIQCLLPFYWITFFSAEISLIITIKGLHQKVYLSIPSRFALALDIVVAVLIIFVHTIAVKIQGCILIRDRINALPEVTVETADHENCVICYDTPPIGERVRQLPCRHTFHRRCIEKWLIQKPSCPICKRRI